MRKYICCASLLLCVSLALIGSILVVDGRAEYPDRPITLWVQYAPGGSTDMTARALAVGAAKILGQQIVVENKPGAGGAVALALLSKAKPDGYTLCYATDSSIVRNPQLQKVQFAPLKDFTPLIAVCAVQNAIGVKKEAPWKTFKELVDYAKKNPNKIKYSSGGSGSGMHHAMAYVGFKEKIEWIHVPYKGNTEAMTALMGGHVDVASVGGEIYPFANADTVRILAIAENKRNPKHPDVPTLMDLGYDFANDAVMSVVGPAGMAPDVAKKIEDAFAKAAEAKEVKALFDQLDLLPILVVGKDYEARLKEYWARMEKGLKETGLIKEPATKPY
jgi:tripartite-type tricarboxylate transporter receptor subunit TctC